MHVHVPASGPPASPALLYAVPTLRWEDHSTDTATVSVRGGGRVRVWFERGWWSSGADEQLGVIGPYLSDPAQPIHHLMTFLRQDMTRGGKVSSLKEDSFPHRSGVVRDVTLPDRTLTVTNAPDDAGTRTVTVVGPSYTSLAGLGATRTDAAVLGRVTCRVQWRAADGPQDELAWVDAGIADRRARRCLRRAGSHLDRSG